MKVSSTRGYEPDSCLPPLRPSRSDSGSTPIASRDVSFEISKVLTDTRSALQKSEITLSSQIRGLNSKILMVSLEQDPKIKRSQHQFSFIKDQLSRVIQDIENANNEKIIGIQAKAETLKNQLEKGIAAITTTKVIDVDNKVKEKVDRMSTLKDSLTQFHSSIISRLKEQLHDNFLKLKDEFSKNSKEFLQKSVSLEKTHTLNEAKLQQLKNYYEILSHVFTKFARLKQSITSIGNWIEDYGNRRPQEAMGEFESTYNNEIYKLEQEILEKMNEIEQKTYLIESCNNNSMNWMKAGLFDDLRAYQTELNQGFGTLSTYESNFKALYDKKPRDPKFMFQELEKIQGNYEVESAELLDRGINKMKSEFGAKLQSIITENSRILDGLSQKNGEIMNSTQKINNMYFSNENNLQNRFSQLNERDNWCKDSGIDLSNSLIPNNAEAMLISIESEIMEIAKNLGITEKMNAIRYNTMEEIVLENEPAIPSNEDNVSQLIKKEEFNNAPFEIINEKLVIEEFVSNTNACYNKMKEQTEMLVNEDKGKEKPESPPEPIEKAETKPVKQPKNKKPPVPTPPQEEVEEDYYEEEDTQK